jgi:hypothetical protein
MDGTTYGRDRTVTTSVAVIRQLKVSPSAFGPGQRTTVTYTDSARATTYLAVLRCVAKGRRCVKYTYVSQFTHHDAVGRNRVSLSTRVGRRRLGAGKYLLEVTPVLRGNVGATVSAAFRVT